MPVIARRDAAAALAAEEANAGFAFTAAAEATGFLAATDADFGANFTCGLAAARFVFFTALEAALAALAFLFFGVAGFAAGLFFVFDDGDALEAADGAALFAGAAALLASPALATAGEGEEDAEADKAAALTTVGLTDAVGLAGALADGDAGADAADGAGDFAAGCGDGEAGTARSGAATLAAAGFAGVDAALELLGVFVGFLDAMMSSCWRFTRKL